MEPKVLEKSVTFTNPVVKYNPDLDKYEDMPLFEDKLKDANETLKSSNIEEFLKSLPPR